MKKKIVMLMGIVCMLTAATACGGQKETNTDNVATATPQAVTSGDSVTTDGNSGTTAGDSQTATEQPTEVVATAQPTEDANNTTEDTEGVVTDPPTYEDVKTNDALGEITVTKVSEELVRVPVVIRDIDSDRLRLLVRGYNEEAKKYIGEAVFVSSEDAKVTDMDGAELEFSDLQPGNVIYVEISGVKESDPGQASTQTIILIQK